MILRVINKFKSLDADFLQVLQQGGGAFAVRVLGAIAAFGVNIYLARMLGISDFGLFSLALTIVSMTAVFSLFGLDSIVLRDVAKDNDGKNNGQARAIFGPIFRLVLMLSIVFVAVIILSSPWLAKIVFSKPQLSPIIIAMAPVILFLSTGNLISAGLKSIHKTKAGMFVQFVFLPLTVVIIYFIVNQFFHLNIEGVTWIFSGMSLFVLVLSYAYWKKVTVKAQIVSKKNAIGLIKKGWPFLLMSSGWLLLTWTDVIVLGIFENEAAVGVYAASSKVALVTSFILVAINAVVAPKFSQLYFRGDLKGLTKLSKQTTRIMTGLVIMPTGFFLFFPEMILSVFGSEFIAGGVVLVILTIGQFFNVACGSVGLLLSMTGHEIIMRNIILGTALFNMGLSVVLVISMGMNGVAIATAVSMIIWNGLGVLAVRKHLGFWML